MGQKVSKKDDVFFTLSNVPDVPIFDKTQRYHTLEATVKNISLDANTKYYNIQCDPTASDIYDIRLEKTNSKFAQIYDTIKIGNTYKFTFYYVADLVVPKSKCRPIITGIDNCTISQITGKLLSILSLVNESKDLKNYEEYVIENNSNMRLIQQKTGKKYTIGNVLVYTKIDIY
jgi:hypothetical protein